MIRCEERDPTYADVIGEARTGVSFEELVITNITVRHAQTGDVLVEIT